MATYSALPATLNLVATVGNDFTLSLTVTENGSSWVATGATLATDIIDSSGAVVATDFTTAASTGSVTLSLTDTQTGTLGVGVYSYRLSVTKSSLTRDWIAGTLSIVEAGVGGSSTSSASLSISNSAVTLSLTSLVAPLAENISVADAGGLFVGSTVEAATQELGLAVERYAPAPSFLLRQRLGNLGLGGPTIVTLVGDSTGDATTDWFYPFLTTIAAAYPSWAVQYRTWNDTTQGYDTPTYVQAGTAGQGYITPLAGSTCTTADSATVSLTSCDVTIRAKVRKTALNSGAESVIVAQFGAAGQRSYRLYVSSSGILTFGYSVDGTTLVDHQIATALQMSAAFSAGVDFYVGVKFTRNNGSNCVAQAIKSDDGITWTDFGTTVTGTTVAGLFDSTANPEIGSRTGGSTWDGRVYWVEVYKGTTVSTAPLAFRFDASLYDSGSSFVDAEGKTWTLFGTQTITRGAPVLLAHNASVSGQNVSYFDNATRRPLVLSAQTDVLIVNSGHNEGSADFGSTLSTYITNALALWPSMAVVVCKQNPEHSTATNYRRHARSMCKLGNQAALNAWGVVDAFQAFQDTGTPDSYVGSADVHPNAAGYTLWTNEALRTFGFA